MLVKLSVTAFIMYYSNRLGQLLLIVVYLMVGKDWTVDQTASVTLQ